MLCFGWYIYNISCHPRRVFLIGSVLPVARTLIYAALSQSLSMFVRFLFQLICINRPISLRPAAPLSLTYSWASVFISLSTSLLSQFRVVRPFFSGALCHLSRIFYCASETRGAKLKKYYRRDYCRSLQRCCCRNEISFLLFCLARAPHAFIRNSFGGPQTPTLILLRYQDGLGMFRLLFCFT